MIHFNCKVRVTQSYSSSRFFLKNIAFDSVWEGDIRDQRFRLNKIMYFFMENEEGAVTLNYAHLTNTLVQKKVEL
jgi:hypothetical protein